ncbi:MAG: O-antigen ligase family protein [Deltaproteobacteria bacterium]|nr:O-antigen ligase family protein [Deltaproteobacteria bacterium]
MSILKRDNFKRYFTIYGPKFGPFCLGAMVLTGPFARGLVNTFFALLLAWGLGWAVARGGRPFSQGPPLPKLWLKGALVFTICYLAASAASSAPLISLFYTTESVYLILTLPMVWLALNQCPNLVRHLPVLYALGLIVMAVMLLMEAGWCLSCIRAKAHLGIIELGAVLGQLPPIMIGALIVANQKKRTGRTVIFWLALAASLVGLRINCSRLGLIAAPLLSMMILAVNWKGLSRRAKLIVVIVMIAAGALLATDQTTVGRFQEMAIAQGNANNDLRKTFWRNGVEQFWAHPILGHGPGAIPSPAIEKIPQQPDGTPAWKRTRFYHAHQVFITVLAESGLIGFFGFMFLHLAPLIIIRRHLTSSDPDVFFWSWSAVAVTGQFALNGLTDHNFTIKAPMIIYYTVIAVALWLPAHRQITASRGEPKV